MTDEREEGGEGRWVCVGAKVHWAPEGSDAGWREHHKASPTTPGSGLSKWAGFGAFTEAGKIRGQGGSREVGSETGREK